MRVNQAEHAKRRMDNEINCFSSRHELRRRKDRE